jgi:hypothetical protein
MGQQHRRTGTPGAFVVRAEASPCSPGSWGNLIQVVDDRDIQFTKVPQVLAAMGLGHLDKSADALDQLARKGIRVP